MPDYNNWQKYTILEWEELFRVKHSVNKMRKLGPQMTSKLSGLNREVMTGLQLESWFLGL